MGIWRTSSTYHTDRAALRCLSPCCSSPSYPGDITGSSGMVTALLNLGFIPVDAAS